MRKLVLCFAKVGIHEMEDLMDLKRELAQDVIVEKSETVMKILPGKKTEEPVTVFKPARLNWQEEFHYKVKLVHDPSDPSRNRKIEVSQSRNEFHTKLLMEHVLSEMETRGFVRGTEHEFLVKEINWYLQRKLPPSLICVCVKILLFLLFEKTETGKRIHKSTCEKYGKKWMDMVMDMMLIPNKVYDDIVEEALTTLIDATNTQFIFMFSTFQKKLETVKKPKHQANLLRYVVNSQIERISSKNLEKTSVRRGILGLYTSYLSHKLSDLRHLAYKGLAALEVADTKGQTKRWKTSSFNRRYPQAIKKIDEYAKEIRNERESKAQEAPRRKKLVDLNFKETDFDLDFDRKNKLKSRESDETEMAIAKLVNDYSNSRERSIKRLVNAETEPLASFNLSENFENAGPVRNVDPTRGEVKKTGLTVNASQRPVDEKSRLRSKFRGHSVLNSSATENLDQKRIQKSQEKQLKVLGPGLQTKGPYTILDLIDKEFKVEVTVRIRPVEKRLK